MPAMSTHCGARCGSPLACDSLDTDLAGPPPYGSEELLINITRPDALEIRQEILAAMKRTKRKQTNAG
jgi:hypothetical protein